MESAETDARKIPILMVLGALAAACVVLAVVAKKHGSAHGVTTAIVVEDVSASARGFDLSRALAQTGDLPSPEPPLQEPSVRAERLGLGSAGVANAVLRGELDDAWIAEAGGERGSGTFAWPVIDGWRVRGFGSGEDGYHKAIDIGGDVGWSVYAADDGIVVYAGDEIPGYGNVVLIVHPGGWITMYAHNSVNFAVAGERVPAGAIIAEVGSTGISRGPHVHFELIFEGKNCDPATLWRPGIRHRDGHLTPLAPLTWASARERPEAIRCHRRMHHPRSRWVIHEEL
jgi:murein DD-endopeptidase MepM/ murein hydrolase activator NlpD